MSKFTQETVLSVHHWNDNLFSFTTTRERGMRFINGQFVMLGIEVDGKPLMRAYSIASPNYEDHLEFLSIKVPDGPLTSRLQHLAVNDTVLVSKKPTGSLVIRDLNPAKNLYLLSTGTGLAPFMSLIQDPDVYEAFEKVILVHCVRTVSELAYQAFITETLPNNEFLGPLLNNKLIYYPTVTREAYENEGRITDLFMSGKLEQDIGLNPLNPETDRVMICGSTDFLEDCCKLLNEKKFSISPGVGKLGDYVIERAFVGE